MQNEITGAPPGPLDDRKWHPTSARGIYKRGTTYTVKFRDGRGRQRSRTAKTLAEAKRLKAELTTDVARGDYRPDTKQTLATYVERWKEVYTGRGSEPIRPETLRDYRRDIDRAVDFMGRRLLTEVDRQAVQAYATYLANLGLKPATVRRILAPLKALLATAADEDLIRYPLAGARIQVRVVKDSDAHEPEDEQAKVLTREQRAALIRSVTESSESGDASRVVMVRLILETGLRIGEALALTWGEVAREPTGVRVRSRVRAGKRGAPKSKNSTRTVPISSEMVRTLAALRLASPYSSDRDYVFPSSTGNAQHAANAYRWYNKAARGAGTPTGFHALRHTAGSAWLSAGVPITQVSVLLGHHNPSFTMSVYAHALADQVPTGDALAAALA